MPATTDTLEALGAISDLAATDILHLMRDPDLPGRVDKKLTAAVLASIISGNSAPRDMLFFNGTDTGARGFVALGTPGDGIGAGKLTVPLRFRVPEVTGTVNYGLWFIGFGSTSYGGGSFSLAAVIEVDNGLKIKIVGPAGTNHRTLTYANFRTAYSGLWKWLHVTWDGVSAPIVYLDTVALTMVESAGGSLPPWSTPVDDDYFVLGLHSSGDKFAGRMVPFAPLNRVWSPAEVAAHVLTGRMPASDEIGTGSMVPIMSPTLNNGGFETAGAGGSAVFTGWYSAVSGTGTVTQDLTVFRSGAASCRLANGVASAYSSIRRSGTTTNLPALKVGMRYRLDYWARSPNGATLRIQNDAGPLDYFAVIPPDAWTQYVQEVTPLDISIVWANSTANGTIYIDDVTITPLGPIYDHGFQPGTYQAGRDIGANGIDLTLAPGVQAITDGKRRPQVRAKNVNVGTAAYLIQSADILFSGWDVDCIQITNSGAASAVGVKVQLSDGTNHTDLMATATIVSGDTLLVYPTVGGLDTRRRLRAVATSGADNLTFNFSLRKRS